MLKIALFDVHWKKTLHFSKTLAVIRNESCVEFSQKMAFSAPEDLYMQCLPAGPA